MGGECGIKSRSLLSFHPPWVRRHSKDFMEAVISYGITSANGEHRQIRHNLNFADEEPPYVRGQLQVVFFDVIEHRITSVCSEK